MAIIAGDRTLGGVRNAYTSKPAFNKAMRMDARIRLLETGVAIECKVCGESRQVDVCHIKPIKDFDEDTKIEVINGPENNIILCPLHHRLLDNNLLDLKDIELSKFNKGIHIIFGFNSIKEREENIPSIKGMILKALEESLLLKGISIRFDE